MPLANHHCDLDLRPRDPWQSSVIRPGGRTANATPRPRLLIVENDAAMGQMLSTALADEYVVELAGDELAACASLRRSSVDLLIVDIPTTGTTGPNLIHALRLEAHTRRLPIVVLTSSEHRQTLLQCLAAGANDFLLKPFGVADLRACVSAELALADTAADA